MQMIRRRKEHLILTAPIDGELGLLDVVLGQSVSSGMKIGQINNLSSYKIEAQIDEHYIDRVMPGLEAQFERQDESYQAVIRKVYPEVRDGKFKADFKFDGTLPENIRTGQTYSLNLQLGQPEEAVMIPRGTFLPENRWALDLCRNRRWLEAIRGKSVSEGKILSITRYWKGLSRVRR